MLGSNGAGVGSGRGDGDVVDGSGARGAVIASGDGAGGGSIVATDGNGEDAVADGAVAKTSALGASGGLSFVVFVDGDADTTGVGFVSLVSLGAIIVGDGSGSRVSADALDVADANASTRGGRTSPRIASAAAAMPVAINAAVAHTRERVGRGGALAWATLAPTSATDATTGIASCVAASEIATLTCVDTGVTAAGCRPLFAPPALLRRSARISRALA